MLLPAIPSAYIPEPNHRLTLWKTMRTWRVAWQTPSPLQFSTVCNKDNLILPAIRIHGYLISPVEIVI